MQKAPSAASWKRHFVYRTERVRTTWKLRIGVVVLVAAVTWLTSGWWSAAIAQSLVCPSNLAPSDAILIENFDSDYLTFERASDLRKSGLAPRVLVPIQTNRDPSVPSAVGAGTAEVMARIAGLDTFDTIPIRLVEPISLNAAYDVLQFLEKEGVRSVIVVTPIFRSRRSILVYEATLGRAGITVRCEPVQGTRGVETWTASWHGVQQVTEQWLKLSYYRLYVLPFAARTQQAAD